MTPQEKERLEGAIKASDVYKGKNYNFDPINDDIRNGFSLRLVCYCREAHKAEKRTQEIRALREFVKPVLGRSLHDNEYTIAVQIVPEVTSGTKSLY